MLFPYLRTCPIQSSEPPAGSSSSSSSSSSSPIDLEAFRLFTPTKSKPSGGSNKQDKNRGKGKSLSAVEKKKLALRKDPPKVTTESIHSSWCVIHSHHTLSSSYFSSQPGFTILHHYLSSHQLITFSHNTHSWHSFGLFQHLHSASPVTFSLWNVWSVYLTYSDSKTFK